MNNWILWASLSAFFAGLTAVLAKWGIEGADADCVTLFRTIVVVVMAVTVALVTFVAFAALWVVVTTVLSVWAFRGGGKCGDDAAIIIKENAMAIVP